VPDRLVPEGDPKFAEQAYWYPQQQQGWEVAGYQFGGDGGGQIGYVLFSNKYSGLLRLFVYLPGYPTNYNQLIARVLISDREDKPLNNWCFPLQDSPPAAIEFDRTAEDAANPSIPSSLAATPNAVTAIWPGSGEAFDNLSPGGSIGSGRWLRAEIPTLFDPTLYNPFFFQGTSTPGGLLNWIRVFGLRGLVTWIKIIFIPGLAADVYRRKLHVSFEGLSVQRAQLFSNLDIQLAGNAVPTAETGGLTAGAVASSVFTAVGDASSALSLATKLGLIAGALSPGGAAIAVAAGAAGLYFSLFGNDTAKPPQYQLNLAGTATGETTGFIFQTNYLPDLSINLSGTFTPTVTQAPDGAEYQPLGFPQSYQRCDTVRIGAFGFRAYDGKSLDPRPRKVAFNWLAGNSEFTPNLRIEFDRPLGNLVVAPWANVAISDQIITLECIRYNQQMPNTVTKLLSFQADGSTSYPVANSDDVISICKQIQSGDPIKVYFRWSATVTPLDSGISSFNVQHALQSQLPILPMLISARSFTELLVVGCGLGLSSWQNTVGWDTSSPDDTNYRIDIDYSNQKVPVDFVPVGTGSTTPGSAFIHDTGVRGDPYPPVSGGYSPDPNIHPKTAYAAYRVKLVQKSNSVVVAHRDTVRLDLGYLDCP
jgi:hypothetical protein